MSRYLVVAHQTAASVELLSKLRELTEKDRSAECVLLVPATPISHLLAWTEGEATEVARQTADNAKRQMEEVGIAVSKMVVGDRSPLVAIEDELREHRKHYDAIVVSTLPVGISKWLGLDLPHQAERKFGLPVIHVVSETKAKDGKATDSQ